MAELTDDVSSRCVGATRTVDGTMYHNKVLFPSLTELLLPELLLDLVDFLAELALLLLLLLQPY